MPIECCSSTPSISEARPLQIGREQLRDTSFEPLALDLEQVSHHTLRVALRVGGFGADCAANHRTQLVLRQARQGPLVARLAPDARKHVVHEVAPLRRRDAESPAPRARARRAGIRPVRGTGRRTALRAAWRRLVPFPRTRAAASRRPPAIRVAVARRTQGAPGLEHATNRGHRRAGCRPAAHSAAAAHRCRIEARSGSLRLRCGTTAPAVAARPRPRPRPCCRGCAAAPAIRAAGTDRVMPVRATGRRRARRPRARRSSCPRRSQGR